MVDGIIEAGVPELEGKTKSSDKFQIPQATPPAGGIHSSESSKAVLPDLEEALFIAKRKF